MALKYVTAALVVASSPLAAQQLSDYQLEVGVSSLGAFVAPSAQVMPDLRVRTPFYFAGSDATYDDSGLVVDGSLDVRSLSVMADYHPFQNGFRVSGGLSLGGYELNGTSVNPTIDGTTYTGTFTAELKQKNAIAPVVSVGWVEHFSDNWGASIEFGGRIATMELTTTGQETLSAADRASFEADLAEINDELDDFNVLPFLAIGVSYKF